MKFVESGGSLSTIGSKDDEWYKVIKENHFFSTLFVRTGELKFTTFTEEAILCEIN